MRKKSGINRKEKPKVGLSHKMARISFRIRKKKRTRRKATDLFRLRSRRRRKRRRKKID